MLYTDDLLIMSRVIAQDNEFSWFRDILNNLLSSSINHVLASTTDILLITPGPKDFNTTEKEKGKLFFKFIKTYQSTTKKKKNFLPEIPLKWLIYYYKVNMT